MVSERLNLFDSASQALNRLTSYERGVVGLYEAVSEIKELKSQVGQPMALDSL